MSFYDSLRKKNKFKHPSLWSNRKKTPKTKDFEWGKAFNLVKDYFINSEKRWLAWLLLIGIIVCIAGFVALTATLTWWSAGFWALLAAKAAIVPFLISIGQFALIIASMVTVYVLKNYLIGKLSLLWRNWLTTKFVMKLENGKNTNLDLNRISPEDNDNLPQRIQEDIPKFVELTINLFTQIFESILSLGTFVGSLWIVGGALSFVLLGLNIVIPGYLVWVALIVAIIATVSTYYIGKSLAETNKQHEKAEADFREELSTVSKDAENIALEQAGEFHQKRLAEKLDVITENANEKLNTQTKLTAFQTFYQQIASILPIILSAPLYFLGLPGFDLGKLMQVSASFMYVNSAFSCFVYSYESISQFQSCTERLTEQLDAFDKDNPNASPKNIERKEKHDKPCIKGEKPKNPCIKVKGLDIMKPQLSENPSTNYIMRNLNLKLKLGKDTLLWAENGVGKSTFAKVVRGSWEYGKGKVTVPANATIYTIPQRPTILPNQTLKEILAYPKAAETYTDAEYARALNAFKDSKAMSKIIPMLHSNKKNWGILSGGERQFISFARAILQEPKIIILDESTSAMDNDNEAIAYRALKKALPESTLISIAHKESVLKYHQKMFILSNNENKETVVIKRDIEFRKPTIPFL